MSAASDSFDGGQQATPSPSAPSRSRRKKGREPAAEAIQFSSIKPLLASAMKQDNKPVSVEEWLPGAIAKTIDRDMVYVDRQTPLTSPRVSLTSEERIKLANRYRPAIRQFLSNLGVGQINTDRIDEKEEERISQEIASRIKYANSLLADGLIDREAYIDLLERARDLSGAEEALSSDDAVSSDESAAESDDER